MLIEISKSGFKARVLELFRLVESSGEPLVVTDHGRPVLEVRSYHASNVDSLDLLRGSIMRYDDPTEPVVLEGCDAATVTRRISEQAAIR